jgi:hypothetical protein
MCSPRRRSAMLSNHSAAPRLGQRPESAPCGRPARELQGARPAVLRDPRLRVPPGGARRYQDLTERQGTFNSVSSSVAANPRDCRPRLASPSAGRSPRQAPGHGFRQFTLLCRGAEVEAGFRSSYTGKQSPARPPQVTFLPASIEPPDGYWFGVAFHRHRAQRSCPDGRSAERCHH